MGNYLRRLVLAFCLSATCYYATEDWYRRTNVAIESGLHQEPIALLQELTNEVQRKPVTRVIWETISKDENLFAGEAIRTSESSEAKIVFLKSGTVIELEPDSLVVLEETDSGLSLDFLKGNLFVKSTGQGGAAGAGLTLKSGKSEINLQNADVSLSKSQGEDVDVQVHGGVAKIKQGEKTLTLDQSQSGTLSQQGLDVTKNQFQILTPAPGDSVYVDSKRRELVTFQWQKISPDYTVFVERGANRTNLIRNQTQSALGSAGQVGVTSKMGKYYWRLVAEPNKPGLPVLKSSIVPFSVIAKTPPVPLEPEHQAQLVLESKQPTVRIKWANPAKLKSLLVEVASDPQLKQKVIQEPLSEKLNFKDLALNKSGDYFWRLTGFMEIKGKLQPVSSEVRKFQIQMGAELVPPELRSPLPQQSISYNQVVEKGLFLSWDPVPGITAYQVKIEKAGAVGERGLASTNPQDLNYTSILDEEVKASPVRANDLTPGTYRWTVVSLDSSGKASSPAPLRIFTITDVPRVDWAQGPEPEEYLYYTGRPSMNLQWLKGTNDKVVSWRYKMADDDQELESATWKPTNKPEIREYVKEAGSFKVQIEALNDKGQTVAKSTVKEVTVRPKPLLPGPQFAPDLPDILQANRKGDLSLKWDPVNGAQKYHLVLKNKAGKVIKQETVATPSLELQRLSPGDYQLFVQTIDEHNRPGPLSSAKSVQVPRTSDIKAPKLKTIQVK